MWVTLAFSKRLQSYVFALFSYISFSPLPLPKSWLSANRQIFDDVNACDLWFRPPQSKILATPMNWRLPEKLFWIPFFFLKTLAVVSLASSIPVLGLESVCPRKGCPWPRVIFVSLALASSLVSSTPSLVKEDREVWQLNVEQLVPWPSRKKASNKERRRILFQPRHLENQDLIQIYPIEWVLKCIELSWTESLSISIVLLRLRSDDLSQIIQSQWLIRSSTHCLSIRSRFSWSKSCL